MNYTCNSISDRVLEFESHTAGLNWLIFTSTRQIPLPWSKNNDDHHIKSSGQNKRLGPESNLTIGLFQSEVASFKAAMVQVLDMFRL